MDNNILDRAEAIKEALRCGEFCGTSVCEGCGYYHIEFLYAEDVDQDEYCDRKAVDDDALALIDAQAARIKELEGQVPV